MGLCPPEGRGVCQLRREPPCRPIPGGGVPCRKHCDSLPCRMCRPGPGKGVDVHPRGASPVFTRGGTLDAFLSGLLFLVHPLQTQAVTYIVQRLASLAALFYLSALACYVWARVSNQAWKRCASDRRDRSLCGPCAFHETKHLHAGRWPCFWLSSSFSKGVKSGFSGSLPSLQWALGASSWPWRPFPAMTPSR